MRSGLLEDPALAYFESGTPETVRAVARQTIVRLKETLGADPAGWAWGRVHTAHWRHPIATPAIADAFDIGPHPSMAAPTPCATPAASSRRTAPVRVRSIGIVVDFADPDVFLARAEHRQFRRAR